MSDYMSLLDVDDLLSPTAYDSKGGLWFFDPSLLDDQSLFVDQSPAIFPSDHLQHHMCDAGDGQAFLAQAPGIDQTPPPPPSLRPDDHDGETSKKSPAKKKAPAKKATAVKRTVNKPAAKKPPASLAPASGVVQAPVAFPRLARGGGNMTGVKSPTRTLKEFMVKMNEDGFALWEPNTRNAEEITILKEAIETLPSDAKTCEGTKLHPLLHVSSVCIPMSLSNDIDNRLYGHRKPGNKAFLQLLSYLGMRSSINENTQVRTLTFDPEGWNRMGYRLVRGGDTKGGKPEIFYVPFCTPQCENPF